jgi:hypothetical protein
MIRSVTSSTISRATSRVVGGGGVTLGGGIEYNPLDSPIIELLLDSGSSTTVLNSISPDVAATSSQTVRRWSDQTENANHANQAVAAWQPIFNGTGLVFDAVNDAMVANRPAVSSNTTIIACIEIAADIPFILFREFGAGKLVGIGQSGSAAAPFASVGTPEVRKNGSVITATTRGQFYTAFSGQKNVITMRGLDFSAWSATAGSFQISGYAGFYANGVWSAIYVYDGALSNEEIEAVETYLIARHGVV